MVQTHINWIKCSDELPKASGNYVVVTTYGFDNEYGMITTLQYSAKHKKWNVSDRDKRPTTALDNVMYWGTGSLPDGLKEMKF